MFGVTIREGDVLPLTVTIRRRVLPDVARIFVEKEQPVFNRVFVLVEQSENLRRLKHLGKARQNPSLRFRWNHATMFRSEVAVQKIIQRIVTEARRRRTPQG